MQLIRWERAKRAIAEALKAYAKQAKEGLKAQNDIAEIKIRAERRMGEMLKDVEREPGKRIDLTSSHDVTRLEETGISRKQSSRYQAIATIPDDTSS